MLLIHKKIDLALNQLFPRAWMPLYTMIAHTTIPYSDALKRARRQERSLLAVGILAAAAIGVILVWWLR